MIVGVKPKGMGSTYIYLVLWQKQNDNNKHQKKKHIE